MTYTKKKPNEWKRGEPRPNLTPAEVKKLRNTAGVRIKPVKCGKPKCKKLHYIYAYKRVYTGGKCKEVYIGKCPYKHNK